MRALGWIAGVAVLAAATAFRPPEAGQTIFVAGDWQGFLSPCGCTSPMSGGIQRMATVLRSADPRALFLVNGGLLPSVGGESLVSVDQDVLKAETLAESLNSMKVTAINLGDDDAVRGGSVVSEVSQLAPDKVITRSSLANSMHLSSRLAAGGFDIESLPSLQSADEAFARSIAEQKAEGKKIAILFRGDLTDATELAQQFQSIDLVVYRAEGTAPSAPTKIGTTWLITPGDRGKSLLRFSWTSAGLQNFAAIDLPPAIPDDPKVAKLYSGYLRRVTKADYLSKMIRTNSAKFGGDEACLKCHADSQKVWAHSQHSHALATLEKQGHGADPDCVSCHVTGLDSTRGFRSRLLTPHLANVTCESCHGSGVEHSYQPKVVKMPKIGSSSCVSCHTTDNSPNFDFKTYWPKISHK